MRSPRRLLVTADDFGIGPATSRGILELAARGRLTATALLVNSPHAESAVREWSRAGRPVELGWHACLTLDRPVLAPPRVPSLVRPDGRFWPLAQFLSRLLCKRIARTELVAELQAQHRRFGELTGFAPAIITTHHHVQIFPPVGAALREVIGRTGPRPWVRRVREPWHALVRVPGARAKRAFLTAWGRADARRLDRAGFPGNDWLAGVSDPGFLTRWLIRVPGRVVELACHPGHFDETLLGRDAEPGDGRLERRVWELDLLHRADFEQACRQAGFQRGAPQARPA